MPGFTPIAVVGVSALLPGSKDVDGFWRSVLNGQDMITDVPASHWLVDDYYDPDPKAPDKTYGKRGAFLDPVDFDPLAYGVPPNQLPATDTTQLLSLLVADGVLADVGSEVDRDRVSVILGTAPLELLATMASRLQRPVWLKALRESGINEVDAQAVCDRIADHYVPWQEASFPGLLSNVVAGRIANRFDLHGTNCTTDAAHVYAVLKGIGTASDGRSTAIYAPLAEGQARALRRAYASAGYGPDTVELVEAHGTGTTAGDLAEFTALRTVFAESGRPESQ